MPETINILALHKAQLNRDSHAEGNALRGLREKTGASQETDPFRWMLTKVAFGMSDCWHWVAYVDSLGYGRCKKLLGEVKAHRIAYRYFKGDIPKGMVVMHSCDVRSCVNPDHLSLGTQADNIADMTAKGRRRSGDSSGERNGQAKLTQAKVAEIRQLANVGTISQAQIAKLYNVGPMTISRVVRRELWK